MARSTKDSPVSIRLFPEQKKNLKAVAREIRLSEQDCFRKALDFGLPVLKKVFLKAASRPSTRKAA